jgi:L-fuculose-phosphate aldolase
MDVIDNLSSFCIRVPSLSVFAQYQWLPVTPTVISRRLEKACDMLLVDLEGRPLPGSKKVTSEINMHFAVYQEREDINAVVHCHPPIATAFACSGRGIDQILCQGTVMTVGTIPLAPYATTGTAEVAISMMPLLQENEAILLENHGAVSYGNTLLDAFMKMETIEHLAHIALVAHQLGSARPLGQERIQQLQSARAIYLQDGHDGLAAYPRPRHADVGHHHPGASGSACRSQQFADRCEESHCREIHSSSRSRHR